MNWKSYVAEYRALAEQLNTVMFGTSVDYLPPALGATDEDMVALERRIGLCLDNEHKSFLQAANGWPSFSGTISLLGSADFNQSSAYAQGLEALGYISGAALGAYRFKQKSLLIVGVSEGTLDVLCMPFKDGQVQEQLIWFNNVEPDVYPSFGAFFKMIKDSLPKSIEYYANKNAQKG